MATLRPFFDEKLNLTVLDNGWLPVRLIAFGLSRSSDLMLEVHEGRMHRRRAFQQDWIQL